MANAANTGLSEIEYRRLKAKSYSLEHGRRRRSKSLIEDARFDTESNSEFNRQIHLNWLASTASQKQQRTDSIGEEENDGVFTTSSNGAVPEIEMMIPMKFTLIVAIKGNFGALSRTIKQFELSKIKLNHLESRQCPGEESETNNNNPAGDCELDFFVECEATESQIENLKKFLEVHHLIRYMKILNEEEVLIEPPWFPRHISDLDNCTHLITKYEPELDTDHPGFCDKEYRKRRSKIVEIAFDYKWGQAIPAVQFTKEEIDTWTFVYNKLVSLHKTHACKQYIDNFRLLEKEGIYSPKFIPQLQTVSNFLRRQTGFTLRPVAGLLSARDFLASLAFRVFQCTQYVRHPSRPEHSPEPDTIHELLGHVPLLADSIFAQFSQDLGIVSLGATDQDIEKLATLYWFTIEFGLCKEFQADGNQEIRAIGAGLLSSFGELTHALSDIPERRPFLPEKTAVQEYQDATYQPIYFVSDNFEDMKAKLKEYSSTIRKPYELRYDAFTQSIQILDNEEIIRSIISVLSEELMHLNTVCNNLVNRKKILKKKK